MDPKKIIKATTKSKLIEKDIRSFQAGTMEGAEEKVLVVPETLKQKQRNFAELKIRHA